MWIKANNEYVKISGFRLKEEEIKYGPDVVVGKDYNIEVLQDGRWTVIKTYTSKTEAQDVIFRMRSVIIREIIDID